MRSGTWEGMRMRTITLALPFMLPRLERALPTELTGLDRPVGAYLRENVHYTFSGFNWTPAFLDLLLQVGTDRIMFSTAYPYGSMTEAHVPGAAPGEQRQQGTHRARQRGAAPATVTGEHGNRRKRKT
jgi:hypothetical protein